MSKDDLVVTRGGVPVADQAAGLDEFRRQCLTFVERREGVAAKHPHYHKSVAHLDSIDVYRVLTLFNVTDPCLGHAIKKLLVAGGRGAGKDITRDVQEAKDSCTRFLEMRAEDNPSPPAIVDPNDPNNEGRN